MAVNENIDKRRRIARIIIIVILVICVPLAVLGFIVFERHRSLTIYEETLEALKAEAVPTTMADLLLLDPNLDQARQEQLWAVLERVKAWEHYDPKISYKLTEPFSLSQEQEAWLQSDAVQKDMRDFEAVIATGYVSRSCTAWLACDFQPSDKNEDIDANTFRYPNLHANRLMSHYYALRLIKSADVYEALLKWRSLNNDGKFIIGVFIDAAAKKVVDQSLVYYHCLHPETQPAHLSILHPREVLINSFIQERFLTMTTLKNYMSQGTYDDDLAPLGNIRTYMWGYLDCAQNLLYYQSVEDICKGKSTQAIDDIPPQAYSIIAAISLPDLQGSAITLYEMQAQERMSQLAINLSHYYFQHKVLPDDQGHLLALSSLSQNLIKGDGLSVSLRYTKMGPSSYLLDIDPAFLPNGLAHSRLRKKPKDLGLYKLHIDSGYIYMDCTFAEMAK